MGVVEALDKVEDGATGLSRCWEAVAVQQLTLQRGKEAHTQGIVIAVPYGTHRGSNARSMTTLAKGNRSVLTPLVRMMDDAIGTSLPESHLQCIEHELGPQVRLHRPAHHPAAKGIHHPGQIKESGVGPDVGDVRYPQLIRALG